MAGLQDIRRRIRSVKNTQQVTKAMKMISAVKLRKAQERLLAMRPYAGKIREVVHRVLARIQGDENLEAGPIAEAFLEPRDIEKLRILVVASDKGLCGGFNATILKRASAFLLESLDKGQKIVHVDVVGRRASDWARKNKIPTHSEHLQIPIPELSAVASSLAEECSQQYQRKEIDAFFIVGNFFRSAVSSEPTVIQVFPTSGFKDELATAPSTPHLLEPDPETVLTSLLPRYVETEIYRALLESSAAEHGARMSAMDKATNNAGEMIASLTLTMNKIRQATITNQIIEVVSGAGTSQ